MLKASTAAWHKKLETEENLRMANGFHVTTKLNNNTASVIQTGHLLLCHRLVMLLDDPLIYSALIKRFVYIGMTLSR